MGEELRLLEQVDELQRPPSGSIQALRFFRLQRRV